MINGRKADLNGVQGQVIHPSHLEDDISAMPKSRLELFNEHLTH